MCGIFATITTQENAPETVFQGLKKLDYRGYDSWGIASKNTEILLHKEVGKIEDVTFSSLPFQGSHIAIGHSRWATHGGVTQNNAHPHTNADGSVVVVHNGIIENYQELRKSLESRGVTFRSETDTEVLPFLIEEALNAGKSPKEAVMDTAQQLEGRYAFVVISTHFPEVIAARSGSPLILGRSDESTYIASDIPAFLEHTRQVSYLDDNEMVAIGESITFFDLTSGEERDKNIITIDWSTESADKGNYEHFMLKEIMEQKETMRHALDQDTAELLLIGDKLRAAHKIFITGCGTAGKVAHAAQHFFAEVAGLPLTFEVSSEFSLYEQFLDQDSVLICVSQSGETADVLEAMEAAKEKGSTIISIVNVEGSSIARGSDHTLFINAGPEKAVASTKAASSQLTVLLLLAYATAKKVEQGQQVLRDAQASLVELLNPRYINYIKSVAEKIHTEDNAFIIGKGANYPMALEAAIKIQEVSYIHAQGFAGGELKHGPLALIQQGTPCICIVGNDALKKDIISNTVEIRSRGGFIIGIAAENNEAFDQWIAAPSSGTASPIVSLIPIQLLSYYLAVLRGNNPDKPRNLAKSVTVK